MDWKQEYIKRSKGKKNWWYSDFYKNRIRRFKDNPPVTSKHISELEYLIINHDFYKTLLKRYESKISEDAKVKWLEKNLRKKPNFHYHNENIYFVKLPLYLINPRTQNLSFYKPFLNDQLMLTLGGLDHRFKKYRWRAIYLFDFLTPNFYKLTAHVRENIIKLITIKTTKENFKKIKQLVFYNWKEIDNELLNLFFEEQFKRKLITPKSAIGIYRRKQNLSLEVIEKLKEIILTLKNGKYILEKISD